MMYKMLKMLKMPKLNKHNKTYLINKLADQNIKLTEYWFVKKIKTC